MKYFKDIPFKWTSITRCLHLPKKNIQIETIDVVFNTRKYGQSNGKILLIS